MKKSLTYSDKLKDPRWQKKRLEILGRDEFACQCCYDTKSTLHVHHRIYMPGDPWDIPSEYLITLCEECHQQETDTVSQAVSELGRAVKTQFLSSDIQQMAGIMYALKMVHMPDVIISVLEHWLTDEDRMKELVSDYFKHLSSSEDLPF